MTVSSPLSLPPRSPNLLRQPPQVTCKIPILSFLSAASTWDSFSSCSPFPLPCLWSVWS